MTSAAYVKWGMDTQEASLSDGHSPSAPNWGEEPEAAWGHIIAGTERRQVPTLAGSYQLFYAGMAALLLDGAPPPVDIADADDHGGNNRGGQPVIGDRASWLRWPCSRASRLLSPLSLLPAGRKPGPG